MGKLDAMLALEITTISKHIKNRKVSPVELVEKTLNRIEKVDPILNTFITINREEAIAEATEMEKEINQGNYKGPLHGIPIGIKDNIKTRNIKTTMGSKIYRDYFPQENAFVIERLKKAGAIIIGKQNTHQFAYGPTGDRSHSGPVRNPYDTRKMTGGSSGGSAAAVSACLSFGAIGTDTGGSIRIPASFCGIVGIKPTYGRVSKRDVYPLSWILDHVGPMTRTVNDNALLLNAISAFDSKDPDAISCQPEDLTQYIGRDIKGLSIGLPNIFFYENINGEVANKIEETVKVFETLGARTKHVDLPNIDNMLISLRVILHSDAYAVHEENLKKFPEHYDEEVLERLLAGLDMKGFEYAKALQVRQLAKREFNSVLEEVDVIITPTMAILPPKVDGRYTGDNVRASEHINRTITRLTSPTNLNGFPSLTVPCGYSEEGMPIGIQLIGKEFEEAKLYQFGYALEQQLSLSTAKLFIAPYHS